MSRNVSLIVMKTKLLSKSINISFMEPTGSEDFEKLCLKNNSVLAFFEFKPGRRVIESTR